VRALSAVRTQRSLPVLAPLETALPAARRRPAPTPPPSPGSLDTGTDLLFGLLLALCGVGIAAGSVAWLLATAANIALNGGRWGNYQPVTALLHPHQLWPLLPRPTVITCCYVLPALLLLTIGVLGRRWWSRRNRAPQGLAGERELESLLPRRSAARARDLRPSLVRAKRREVGADDTGILLGTLTSGRSEVRSSWEDVLLAIMAPRSGKTSALAIPAILRAPGPVLLTSNKAGNDAYAATLEARSVVGSVWTFDPQQIAHARREMWWDILADARELAGARRLASHFVAASVNENSAGDFWATAASNTLAALFLAAARDGRPITDVLGWLASPNDRTPVDLLRDHGLEAVAEQLHGTVNGAVETRDGIYETSRQYVACLLDPKVAAWVTPQPGLRQFRPEAFAAGRDTLYLLSKDGGGSAAALIAACADAVMRTAVIHAERAGGRLDPPMLAILDEAANVCKISDLPDLYSHLGSRGVIPVTILQSYRQGVRVWGEAGMDALWSAATVKVIGSGIDDADFADRLSRLVGEHEVPTLSHSTSESGKSSSISMRTERILPPDAIRALPKGQALLLATGVRPAVLDLKPWYRERGARELIQASARVTAGIVERSRASADDITPAPNGLDASAA
jgi:type IV secretory pathway TraG/TraD family ATPase VirD4